jgi:two-component system chemotaxis sensor kinase CheA
VDTIRLATTTLDTLLLQAEEILIPKLAAEEHVREVRALCEAFMRCHIALQRVRASRRRTRSNGPVEDSLAGLDTALQQVGIQAQVTLRHLTHDASALAGTVDSLLAAMRRLRLAPASTVLDLFPRMVHDLAREQGKEVEWVAQGADQEVDRKILEQVKDPLIHLVRNAIDHGIEPPAERVQAGKVPQGRVVVTVALLEGERLEIRVEDDGRGIDLAQVRATAVRSGVLSAATAASLNDEEALALIYRSGLSTSPIITNVSGHGLGLAIVKERVEGLRGTLHLETQGRTGTTLRLLLPATIATFRGLLVQAGGQPLLFPLEAVERVLRVVPDEVKRLEEREVIRYDGHVVPIARLSELLGLPEPVVEAVTGGKRWCVMLRSGEDRVACIVTEVSGDREGVVKVLRPPLVRLRNVAGACLLATGQVVLILRPMDVLKSLQRKGRTQASPPATEQEGRAPVILVVDDSITTRIMEKHLLEMAGYQVRMAVDGVEAWDILQTEACDLVLLDVEMPRMNGFALTAQIRADRTLADLPVILVTALASREDQERGIEVGANAYIVKADFDQSHLLEIIRRLV